MPSRCSKVEWKVLHLLRRAEPFSFIMANNFEMKLTFKVYSLSNTINVSLTKGIVNSKTLLEVLFYILAKNNQADNEDVLRYLFKHHFHVKTFIPAQSMLNVNQMHLSD